MTIPISTDAILFGDLIDAGPGNDRIFGLGGADVIHGMDGDDVIDGGANGDLIFGEQGDDTCAAASATTRFTAASASTTSTAASAPTSCSARRTTIKSARAAAHNNLVDGGAGDDVLKGSDEGTDNILGGLGRDYLFGFGGNDLLSGGEQNDILDGGAGDDFLQGGLGTDVLVGGADHDIILGNALFLADDNAVDYLYGDFGTNLDEAGSGRDRLFGMGGNDLEFGEGEDDEITDALGASNLIDFGAGEGADPTQFVPPVPTPNPTLSTTTADPRAVDTLPSGPTYAGWWAEIAGSATGFGLSGGVGAALDATVTSDANGVRYAAWSDTRNGNYEIYVARQTATGWEMIGNSAAGGGVSATTTDSRRPALLIDNGVPIVAWTEVNANGTDILAAQYDAVTDSWVALATSLTPGGISQTGARGSGVDPACGQPADRSVAGYLVAAAAGVRQDARRGCLGRGYAGLGFRRWHHAIERRCRVRHRVRRRSHRGRVQRRICRRRRSLRTSTRRRELDRYRRLRNRWRYLQHADREPRARCGVAERPAVRRLARAHRRYRADLREDLRRRRVESAGPDGAFKEGVSGTTRRSFDPKLEAGGGELFLAWVDHDAADYADPNAHIYVKRWNGTQFVATLAGDANGKGISATGGKLSSIALSVDEKGLPSVAWTDDSSGLPQVYLRSVTQLPGNVFIANSVTSVQAILNANDLGAGDVILLAPGFHAGFTLDANDAGVTILGVQGGSSVITGQVVAECAAACCNG